MYKMSSSESIRLKLRTSYMKMLNVPTDSSTDFFCFFDLAAFYCKLLPNQYTHVNSMCNNLRDLETHIVRYNLDLCDSDHISGDAGA